MSLWADPVAWARLRGLEACVICGLSGMHFYPRYPGDAFEGGPIDRKVAAMPVYRPGEITAVRARLLEALRAV